MPRSLPLVLLVAASVLSGCDKNGSPTGPSGQATRIIALDGSLDFDVVQVGQSADRQFTIRNTGTDALTVTSLQGPGGGAFSASFTSGTVPAGGSQPVTVRFAPQEPRVYSGVLTVEANQTGGNNGINIRAIGDAPIWTMSGAGNSVFDMPTYISRVEIRGTWNETSTSNFIVRVGGQLVVNVVLRDSITYQGIHLVSGGVTEITNSANVAWTFTEVRTTPAPLRSGPVR